MTMTHHERIRAAVRGEPVDRVPVALWRHFPRVDQSAEGLARAVGDFHEAFDFDLVKVTEASGYLAEAWGCKLEPADNPEGTRIYLHRRVTRPADWHELEPLGLTTGLLARELRALELVRQMVGDHVHVMPTIFSPLTVAKQLASEALMLEHVRSQGGDLEAGLAAIRDVAVAFSQACLDHGADSIFFASQFARRDKLDDAEYRRFGVKYDVPVIEAVRPTADVVLLHLHGHSPMFELAAEYGVDAVNWHAGETDPSLADGLQRLPQGAVVGGLARGGALATGTPADVAREVQRAVEQTGGRRLIVSCGCVMLTSSPPQNIRAVRDAVEG